MTYLEISLMLLAILLLVALLAVLLRKRKNLPLDVSLQRRASRQLNSLFCTLDAEAPAEYDLHLAATGGIWIISAVGELVLGVHIGERIGEDIRITYNSMLGSRDSKEARRLALLFRPSETKTLALKYDRDTGSVLEVGVKPNLDLTANRKYVNIGDTGSNGGPTLH